MKEVVASGARDPEHVELVFDVTKNEIKARHRSLGSGKDRE